MMGDKNKKETGNGKASETAKDWMACKGQFNRVADISWEIRGKRWKESRLATESE